MVEPWQVIEGDALAVLRTLPADHFHTCVTSPPYWALRDYGTGRWEGGDPECDHLMPPGGGTGASTLGPNRDGLGQAGVEQVTVQRRKRYRGLCGKCGARRVDLQLGLEERPDCFGWATGSRCGQCYVCRMTAVFREVKRVLRPDGTLWVNVGDTFASGWPRSARWTTPPSPPPRPRPFIPPCSRRRARE